MAAGSRDALVAWSELLAQLGTLGTGLRTAIASGDAVAALAAMVELRRVRGAFARVEAPAEVAGADGIAALAEARARIGVVGEVDALMGAWLARPLPAEATLLGSPLGVAVLADALLPAVWDYETDVIVLAGDGLGQIAELLADVGQRRVVVHGATASAVPPSAIGTTTRDELIAALRTMTPLAPSRFVVHAAAGTPGETLADVTELARSALADMRIHRNTVQAFSRTWVEQGLANLPALAKWPSIAALDDQLRGKPMVIVAPGPSLARNAAQLRELRGRAIVCAFSHSLRPVLAAGVQPDLVLTVDPQDVRYHFAGCDVSRTCLVNAATVHPSLFELGAPRCLTLSANCAIDNWLFGALGEQAMAAGGGSVATTAYSLALRWGCDPIVFVGLDLSFPGGQYYVGTSSDGGARAVVDDAGRVRVEGWSTGFHAMKERGGPAATAERAIELPGWHGGTVPSSFMFSMFHRWFVERTAAVTGTRVYNCTEGGCAIAGMAHRPLAEVIAALADRAPTGVTAILERACADVPATRRAALAAHVATFAQRIGRVRQYATRARTLARRADPARDAHLAILERALGNALRTLDFVSLLAQREIERAHDVASRPAAAADYRASSARLFETVLEVVDQLTPWLGMASARLDAQRRAHEAA